MNYKFVSKLNILWVHIHKNIDKAAQTLTEEHNLTRD